MDLSIIIPAYNEEESIEPLVDCIYENLKNKKIDFETILIDDGSTDKTWNKIKFIHSGKSIFLAVIRFFN